ncbi:MAG: NADH:ubiquinone reductase (Na(+)-transporting) subunit B, partial [Aeromonas sp.]
MSFKQLLENMEHHFEPGGKYAKYYALFEAAYTLFYTPGSVTRNASHVRDA